MKSNIAVLFLLFTLSAFIEEIMCEDDNDDTSVVDAVDLGEDGYFPEFGNFECRETEEYSGCDANPACQRNCNNLDKPGIPCPRKSCIAGCICRKNFVRSELYGGCIPEDQCGRVKH